MKLRGLGWDLGKGNGVHLEYEVCKGKKGRSEKMYEMDGNEKEVKILWINMSVIKWLCIN